MLQDLILECKSRVQVFLLTLIDLQPYSKDKGSLWVAITVLNTTRTQKCCHNLCRKLQIANLIMRQQMIVILRTLRELMKERDP